MNLEKATSRSSDAGVAGWIASNDATLFTVVLVVAIAIFLHARLTKGARETLQLTGEKETLAGNLASTSTELESARRLLGKTTQKLALTQQERDQLQRELIDKLDQISQLNVKLDALLKEKSQLEEQRQLLTQAKQSLTDENTVLTAERASLAEDRDSLTTANASLSDRLDAIAEQLADKVAALEQVEKERARLKSQADELDTIVTTLKQRLESLNINLTETQTRAAASDAKVQELQTQLAAGDKKAEEYLAELARATALFQGLRAEKEQLQLALSEAEQQHQAELLEEGRNNRELVGLKGRLERVAILFDASGSMRQPGAADGSDRWADAQAIAAKWLKHLNVRQCVLIVFSSDIHTFPDDGSLADLRGADGQAKREWLLKQLKAVSPAGWTDTLAALRTAYEYDVDTILLFSDGAPSKSSSGLFDVSLARQIYALCREHPDIPVNTIGLGNYFDEDTSTFLRSVAKITGGTFRGK